MVNDENKTKEQLIKELQEARLKIATLEETRDGENNSLSDNILRIQRRAINSVQNGIIIADANKPDMPIIYCNPAFEKITGYSQEEAIGRNSRFLQGDNTDKKVTQQIRRAIEEKKSCKVVIQNYRKDGQPYWNELMISPVFNNKEELTHFISIQNDITARKNIELKQKLLTDKLKSSQERFWQVMNSISDHIYVSKVTADGNYDNLYLSPHIESLTGYPWGKFMDNWDFWPSIIHPDDKITATNQARQLATGKDSEMEYRMIHANGNIIWVRDSGKVTKACDHIKIYGVVSDITRRKQAEAETHRHNRRLILLNQIIATSATNPSPKAILETTCNELAQAFVDVEQVIAALLNDDKTEATIIAEYRKEGRTNIDKTMHVSNTTSLQYILRHKKPMVVNDSKEGQQQHNTILALPLIIKDDVIGCICLKTASKYQFTTEDVTLAWNVADQVSGTLARSRLAKERQRLITAIEQTAESMVVTDIEGNITYVNPAFERITGYNRDEVIGKNSDTLLKSDEQDDAFYNDVWQTISAGKVWHGYFINKKKDGSIYTEDATITPVRNDKGDIVNYVAVRRDVTYELELEAQYRHAQKMEAVGRLAGGIAHDFNNILTVITGQTDLLLEYHLSPDDPHRKEIGQIKAASERAVILTRKLLAFSHRQPLNTKIINLNDVISGLEGMLCRLISANVELKTNLFPNLGYVKADSGQIEQAVMNLVVNACDAMPQGGKIVIGTVNIDLTKKDSKENLEIIPGRYVRITVQDTGTGIDKKTQKRIFEPFFTTKGIGKGTGLGLSTIYGIILQSDGYIWVDSELGQGTIFSIYLPLVKEQNTTKEIEPAPISSPLDGTETILLVEDEAGVRFIARKFLQKRGYTILEASQADEAIQLCEQHKDEIALLITDVVMPNMSGQELANHLTQLHPNIKVMYISGYPDEALSQYGVLLPGVAFLEKPFSSENLARKVRQALAN